MTLEIILCGFINSHCQSSSLRNSRIKDGFNILAAFQKARLYTINCLMFPELIKHLLKTEHRRCFLLMFAFSITANKMNKVMACN